MKSGFPVSTQSESSANLIDSRTWTIRLETFREAILRKTGNRLYKEVHSYVILETTSSDRRESITVHIEYESSEYSPQTQWRDRSPSRRTDGQTDAVRITTRESVFVLRIGSNNVRTSSHQYDCVWNSAVSIQTYGRKIMKIRKRIGNKNVWRTATRRRKTRRVPPAHRRSVWIQKKTTEVPRVHGRSILTCTKIYPLHIHMCIYTCISMIPAYCLKRAFESPVGCQAHTHARVILIIVISTHFNCTYKSVFNILTVVQRHAPLTNCVFVRVYARARKSVEWITLNLNRGAHPVSVPRCCIY